MANTEFWTSADGRKASLEKDENGVYTFNPDVKDGEEQKEVLISPYGNVIGKPRNSKKKKMPGPKKIETAESESTGTKKTSTGMPPLYGGKSENSHTYYGTKERKERNNYIIKALYDTFNWTVFTGLKDAYTVIASFELDEDGNPMKLGPLLHRLLAEYFFEKMEAGDYSRAQLQQVITGFEKGKDSKRAKTDYPFNETTEFTDRVLDYLAKTANDGEYVGYDEDAEN